MASFARPSADIARGNWVTQSGATANLWATLDEESADDADFVICPINANTAYEVQLSSVAPAVIPRNHIIGLRGRKDSAGGNTKGVDVALVQGTTVLGTQSFPDLPASVTQQNIELPRAMAAGITNYADLRLRFTPTGITSGGSSRRRVVITGAALRVPSASDLVDDLLTRWSITVTTNEPGNVVVSWNSGQFAGQGETLARAVWTLYRVMQTDSAFYAANGPEIERRFAIAYGLWKVIEYERIRAEIVADTYPLPVHQTKQFALDKVDGKISRFIASAKAADVAEPV